MKREKKSVRRTASGKSLRQSSLVAGALSVALLAGLGGALWLYGTEQLQYAYPIRYVRIEGKILQLDEDALSRAIEPFATIGFFDVDLAAIESAARSFAWVGDIRVARQWPDTLVLKVSEHRPLARWNKLNLISDRGVRFTPPNPRGFDSLPHLSGPEGQEILVFQTVGQLDAVLRPHHVRVAHLNLTARQSWTALLSDGREVIIGRQDPVISVERLLRWLPELERRHAGSAKKVDLRYRNGFTVVWGIETERDAIPPRNDRASGDAGSSGPLSPDVIPQVAALQW
jgi:cell division protein FtsQ